MSDWGLGKKLNSQIADVPLNHLIWLNDYKTFGEDSYVFQNKDILHELYKSHISANDISMLSQAFNFIFDNNQTRLGLWMSNAYDLKTVSEDLKTCKSISDIVLNETCLNAIASSNLSDLFYGRDEVLEMICTTDFLNKITQYNHVMNVLESSSRFKDIVLSSDYIQTITGDSVYDSEPITVNNALIVSVTVGTARNNTSEGRIQRGTCKSIYHGATDEITVVSPSTESNNLDIAVTCEPFKFVKSLTVYPANVYAYTIPSTNNEIKYVQLDNVI